MYAEAERFYLQRHPGSWVPEYLTRRGLPIDVQRQWNTGYAPDRWTALTDHLRSLRYTDAEIEASGLGFRARGGSRNIVDLFRNRAVWPIRNEHGVTVAFIGRAAEGTDDHKNPKYINSPDCTDWQKGHILFGLAETRERLAAGARPVIVEGVLDAIAINAAGSSRYAAVATCGVTLTAHHIAALMRCVDAQMPGRLADHGMLMAMDGDEAGKRGMIDAYHASSPFTGRTDAVLFPPRRDPAELLRTVGASALIEGLGHYARPLADLVIDTHIEQVAARFEGVRSYDGDALLDTMLGKLMLTREAANLITQMHPTHVARQVARIADRLGLERQHVTGVLVEAITTADDSPKFLARLSRTDGVARGPASANNASQTAAQGFPTSTGRRLNTPHQRHDDRHPTPPAPTGKARSDPQQRG
jgi:DNA primase